MALVCDGEMKLNPLENRKLKIIPERTWVLNIHDFIWTNGVIAKALVFKEDDLLGIDTEYPGTIEIQGEREYKRFTYGSSNSTVLRYFEDGQALQPWVVILPYRDR